MTKQLTMILVFAAAAMIAGCASSSPIAGPQTPPDVRRARAVMMMPAAESKADKGDIEGAIEAYREIIQMSGNLYAAWNNMGELMMRQDNYADAVSAFNIAADLEPTDPRPKYNIGVAYQSTGWADLAGDYFSEALERDPSYLPALRGATRSAEYTGYADDITLDRIRRGLLREVDPAWRTYFERQRFRVEAALRTDSGG